MPEAQWRTAVSTIILNCERSRAVSIADILSGPRRPPMPAADRRRLQKQAALFLLGRITEAA
jgi:hypothetical protein